MTARRRTTTAARAAFAACALLLAACAAPANQATPPTTSAVTASSATGSGSTVTVSPLSRPSGSSPAKPSAAPSASAPRTSAVDTPVSTSAIVEPANRPPTAEPVDPPQPPPATVEPDTTAPQPPPATPATRDPAPPRGPTAGGKVVVIDPGHNGGNAAAPGVINALVPAGFGQTKPCNTTGTETNDGFPEHDFTWSVANDLRPLLQAKGITVVMTRNSDAGVGPCVNERAAIGNGQGADVVVSIHGDGDDASAEGFYVMTAEQDPAGAAMAARSQSLAVSVRDGLVDAGLSPSNHLGAEGLWPRNDLAGLNLSVRPTVMIEAGNMRNASDAALMRSGDGQQQVAKGLADGVLSYLGTG